MEIAFAEPVDIDQGVWFSDDELAAWPPLAEEKNMARLLGRIAVKKAAVRYFDQKGMSYLPTALIVRHDALGAPLLYIGTMAREDVRISLSHESAGAVAAVDASDQPSFGVDIERIRFFDEHFLSDFLTPEERHAISALPAIEQPYATTRLWSLKEAFLKALGAGLREHPNSLMVRNISHGKYEIFQAGQLVGGGEELSVPMAGRIGVIVHLSL